MYIVINKDALEMVAAADTMRWASLIAWVHWPDNEIIIVDTNEKKSWSIMTQTEMATLYTNMSGEEAPGDYSQCLDDLCSYGATWENYPESADKLEAIAAKMPERPNVGSKKHPPIHSGYADRHDGEKAAPARQISSEEAKPKRAPKESGEAPSAPRKAGSTKDVWDIAEGVLTEKGAENMKALRTAIVAECVAKGINPGTAATQYGKWKASKGL